MNDLVGYRTLTKRDFYFSDIAAFGLLKVQKVKLARRPLRRLFFLGKSSLKYLDMEVVTNRREGLRGAAEARVRYFSMFGQELLASHQKQYLFADPVQKTGVQRVWFMLPEGAVFALLEIARNCTGVSVGVSTRLKLEDESDALQGVEDLTEIALTEILRCRDERLLASAYGQAEEDCAHDRALRILTRMAYLWQKPEILRAIEYLTDTRRAVGQEFSLCDYTDFSPTGQGVFEYSALLSGCHVPSVMLSKLLRHEVQTLALAMNKARADCVRVTSGPDAFLRLIVAKHVGVSVEWVAKGLYDDLPLWISCAEAESFIEQY